MECKIFVGEPRDVEREFNNFFMQHKVSVKQILQSAVEVSSTASSIVKVVITIFY